MNSDVMIRPCRGDDAAALAAMYTTDRAELERDGRAPSFFEADGQRERITRLWPAVRTLGFVVLRSERVVGLFLLEDVTVQTAIVGYYIAPQERGRRVATRALGLVVEAAFWLGLREVIADIRPDNVASHLVAERNGFRFTGTVEVDGAEHDRLVLAAPTH